MSVFIGLVLLLTQLAPQVFLPSFSFFKPGGRAVSLNIKSTGTLVQYCTEHVQYRYQKNVQMCVQTLFSLLVGAVVVYSTVLAYSICQGICFHMLCLHGS